MKRVEGRDARRVAHARQLRTPAILACITRQLLPGAPLSNLAAVPVAA
jgi:hypothetical protein